MKKKKEISADQLEDLDPELFAIQKKIGGTPLAQQTHRIIASTIIERGVVVVPPPEPWVEEWWNKSIQQAEEIFKLQEIADEE